MSEKKIEKIGGPWGGLLIRKINEIIDVLNGEDEEKPEGFQGPRGEPGVPGAGMRKSKDWREEVERIMREDRHRFLRVAHTVYYYKEKLNEMLQLIEEEKEKSQRGVFTKEEWQFLKCVLNDEETVRYYSNGGDGYLGEHIEPILEKIDKLSSKGNEE